MVGFDPLIVEIPTPPDEVIDRPLRPPRTAGTRPCWSTPPSLQGTLQRPGESGGANWGGAVFDLETGLLYVRTSEDADTNQVCVDAGNDPEVDVDYSNNCPYGATLIMFRENGRLGAV